MEKYELLKKIGEGTYGIVYKAQNKVSGTCVAIKKFKDSDDDEYVRKTALREIRILKQLKHDHIVDLLEVFREDNRIFLVFEQLNRTILDELQGRNDYSGIEPLEAKKIIWQMLKACDFMHSHNIVHRDFKPENMLLSRNGVLKICDFGFARQLTQQNISEQVPLTEYVSTRWYRAPELLVGAPSYTHSVDVWAIGCIFVELVTGSAIFSGDSDFEMLKLIINMFTGSEKLPEDLRATFARNNLFKNVSLPSDDETAEFNSDNSLDTKLAFLDNNSAVSFARECLRIDPNQRPTAEQLLEHDYFNDFRDWFEDEIQTLMEYDQQEMRTAGLGTLKQRESALKTRRIETLLGENPVASVPTPNANLASQSMRNPFFANSLKQSQQALKEDSHSPVAPRDLGTPIRESRLTQLAQLNQAAPRNSTNADTPTLLGAKQSQPYPVLKQSSLGSVIYDSTRKTRESIIEENRMKQASSLSPTRMLQDMSRQEAHACPVSGARTNNSTLMQTSSSLHSSIQVQKQLPSFGGSGQHQQHGSVNGNGPAVFGGGTASSMTLTTQNTFSQATSQVSQANTTKAHGQPSDESRKLYSVVIKEDPAEQLSPTFQARKGFFPLHAAGNASGVAASSGLNRNTDFNHHKQKTYRERERERLNNESQNSRGRSVTKININFNGDGSSSINNPMTSSSSNLALQMTSGGASPRLTGVDDPSSSKFYGSKLYASNSSAISGIQTKKTLQSNNSTSNLETSNTVVGVGGSSVAASISKGAYYPMMRGKQNRDTTSILLGLNTIQSSQQHSVGHQQNDFNQGVTGVGYGNPSGTSGSSITKPSKVSLPSQSMNFPSFDEDIGKVSGTQVSSLIQVHGSSNTQSSNNLLSQKSIQAQQQQTIGSSGLSISPKGLHHGHGLGLTTSLGQGMTQPGQMPSSSLLAPSSSSYQFPLQALGQGLTSVSNPAKEQPRLKAMMLRNQSSSSTSPMGHSIGSKVQGGTSSVGSKLYSSTQSSNAQQLKIQQTAPPPSSHGASGGVGATQGGGSVSSNAVSFNENLNIANQKGAGQASVHLPKPNVKIIDLQHNLLPFDSGLQGAVGQLPGAQTIAGISTSGQAGGGMIASNTGQQIISDNGVRIDAQSLKLQLKQGKKDAVAGGAGNPQVMSQQQHYLLQQIQVGHHGQQASGTASSSHGGAAGPNAMLPQSSGSGLFVAPKTPNDIYGFQQKAILHQIFDKGSNGHSRSKVMTRHTTPFNNQPFGVSGKLTTTGGSNPKLVTIQQLIGADGTLQQEGLQGGNQHNFHHMQTKGSLVPGSSGGGSGTISSGPGVPGGNRPGINSSGAAVKKNGSMGLVGAGISSSYANYKPSHHMSSHLQNSYNRQGPGQASHALMQKKPSYVKTNSLGSSGTIHTQQQQQILIAQTQMPTQMHPGSSGAGASYSKASLASQIGSIKSGAIGLTGAYNKNQHQTLGSGNLPGSHILKLSPKDANSRLSQGATAMFTAK